VAERQNFSSDGPREALIGYSRSVRVGKRVFVAGCTASMHGKGRAAGGSDLYAQATLALANVETGLRLAGAEARHVVRTRVYLTDPERWEEAARAHREAFGPNPPASSFLGVPRLLDPELLVEIDADAIITD
jgi:enamine deaminase RidA (YjgF/YER057c/UK114 family)